MYLLTILKNTLPLILAICLQLIILTSTSFAQKDEERILNKVPKHLPLKIEILNDDQLSPLDEVKIKITNIGKKPIYYMSLKLITTDDFPKPNGAKIGLSSLKYGRSRLGFLTELASEDDTSLKKDESVVFEIKQWEISGFYSLLDKDGISSEPNFDLIFQLMSFGDGTGFVTTGGTPYPAQKPTHKFVTPTTKGFF